MDEKPQALLDMDGTVCDYDGQMEKDLAKLRSPDEPDSLLWARDEEPPYIEERILLIQKKPGWWENLPRLQLGFDVLDTMRELGYRVMVLTQGPRSTPEAWTQKVQWCQRELPEDVECTITRNKGLVYGRVLVDDFPDYILQWLENRPRGLVVMPAHRWNKDFHHPQVVRYDGTNLEEVRARLVEARDRK